jgi:hypothetical protein
VTDHEKNCGCDDCQGRWWEDRSKLEWFPGEITTKKHQPGEPYQIRLPAKYNGKTVEATLWQANCICGYTTAPYPWKEMALRATERHIDEQTLPPRVYEAERRREDRYTGSLACPAHIPCGHSLVDHSDGRWHPDGTPVNPRCTRCDCPGR